MKIYEYVIPETWPFRFAILNNKLVNAEERPIPTTTSWWSRTQGYFSKPLFNIVDGTKQHYNETHLIIPTFNVSKTDYNALIDDWMEGLMDEQIRLARSLEIDDDMIIVTLVKKDWIDHWEVGAIIRQEIIMGSLLLRDIPSLFI